MYHIRQQPAIHAFKYPLYFSIVDLDEASELFGGESVQPIVSTSNSQQQAQSAIESKGTLWPLSSLMLLRDIDHLKNGEGLDNTVLPTTSSKAESTSTTEVVHDLSMRERVLNLVKERTNGKLDLCSQPTSNSNNDTERRRILLVTHLMYYGYCFNPVSFYIILKPSTNNTTTTAPTQGEEIEAVVAEVSNTPWNEMFIYVLHPDSVDTFFHDMYPSNSPESLKLANTNAKTYRYTMHKKFHVSPFMTMDHDYDWKFSVCRDRLKVEVKLIKRPKEEEKKSTSTSSGEENGGTLYFTAGFDIERTIRPTTSYPLQLAKVIMRFPIYCFIIQIWIHYEALRLLMKGVEFIPHPEGSETGASRVIAVVMRPVFAAVDVVDAWWSEWKSRHHGKGIKVD